MAITTHVLDTCSGAPARGVAVQLERLERRERPDGPVWAPVGRAITDGDGRCRDLTPEEVPLGCYRLVFATGDWFAAAGRDTFYPEVSVMFDVSDAGHHHVPLLLAPFGYSTYRGS